MSIQIIPHVLNIKFDKKNNLLNIFSEGERFPLKII